MASRFQQRLVAESRLFVHGGGRFIRRDAYCCQMKSDEQGHDRNIRAGD